MPYFSISLFTTREALSFTPSLKKSPLISNTMTINPYTTL